MLAPTATARCAFVPDDRIGKGDTAPNPWQSVDHAAHEGSGFWLGVVGRAMMRLSRCQWVIWVCIGVGNLQPFMYMEMEMNGTLLNLWKNVQVPYADWHGLLTASVLLHYQQCSSSNTSLGGCKGSCKGVGLWVVSLHFHHIHGQQLQSSRDSTSSSSWLLGSL